MSDAVTFPDTTPRFGLPLLHAGQAQKEAFVNEVFLTTDALLHCAIRGETSAPPSDSQDGDAWLVAAAATGEWAAHSQRLAVRQNNAWRFFDPVEGMRVFDVSRGCEIRFRQSWIKATLPVEPLGGSIVDGEARAAINDLVSVLQALGIVPSV
ncbi:DUF2793 domain-containing protein [Novosphingobium sp. Leaf2]|uniref:DUF2793 domain-containing protein n=1 Tax=Novosphingobium sp. Leaf2 TaxID=1735670 RepID=UPI0006FE3D27|nr:DUF2793 domain-containing protein [Novosphingobium sp. Leaf2]KQM20256.1 hypothetical protein ASE49_17225 [Novosphingobium sp. Leaf2]